ncbi:MAG: hypothetical protein QGF46_02300 [Planctomycetota bacterium]|jgi:hypothetical protein|nr:hypothetical protein [Planctomycetota bacterium]
MQILLNAILTLGAIAAQQQDAEVVLADAYLEATESNKNLFIELRADW